jgi:predicted metalloprotease
MVVTRRWVVAVTLALAIITVAATLALFLFRSAGFEYNDPFDPLPSRPAQGTGTDVGRAPDSQRRLDAFLRFVFTDVQRFWARTLERSGVQYAPATLVVFERPIMTGCGPASPAVGPFYCALDRRVYLEAGFFRELAVEFHAPGDFADAYVVAHEMGHHVQNLAGILAQVMAAARHGSAPPNELSIRLELQADCFAGVWGHSTYERGMLERGDLEEALRATAAVGDDRIQRRTIGRIDPETWTHGSSEQRRSWWLRGYTTGDPDACDTFSDGV